MINVILAILFMIVTIPLSYMQWFMFTTLPNKLGYIKFGFLVFCNIIFYGFLIYALTIGYINLLFFIIICIFIELIFLFFFREDLIRTLKKDLRIKEKKG
jgi:hypothetical protein